MSPAAPRTGKRDASPAPSGGSPAPSGASPAPVLDRHVDAFLEMMAAERGAARNTIESYRRDLTLFAAYARDAGRAPETADAGLLRGWLSALARDAASPRTAARRLSALRQFFGFLYAEGIRGDDPTITLDSPRPRPGLPKYLSEAEVVALLEAAGRRRNADGARLVALMEVLYATGLRVSELVGLPLSAIARDGRMLVVRGKGGKERMVPLTDAAMDGLASYRAVRSTFLPAGRPAHDGGERRGSPYLFPSRSREGHLTRVRFFQLIKELAVEAGIDPARVSPHVLRHSFASHLLAHGADLRSLQQMLGHADIGTTQIYTHVLDDRLRALVNQCHPLSRPRTPPRER